VLMKVFDQVQAAKHNIDPETMASHTAQSNWSYANASCETSSHESREHQHH